MACFAATLGLIILSGFIHISAANKDACDLYAAVGQSLTLPFVYDGLTTSHVLRWTQNSSIIFYRQQGRVSVGKAGDISTTGSLLLKSVQPWSAGTYQAKALHPNDTLAKAWTGQLCLMGKVPKPKLTYSCDFKSNAVNLNCHVADPQGLVFSWTLDENTLTSETKQKLYISLPQLKGERNFTCAVANKVSKEKSDTVRPICKSPSPPVSICFPPKTILLALAAGGGLILILLITIIILCCRYRRIKTKMSLRDKGELRMLSLSKRDPEYETMHPHEESPPVNLEPSPRACYETVSQPEAPTANRPLQLPAAAEGRQPSPVPKPRKKSPQTPNN